MKTEAQLETRECVVGNAIVLRQLRQKNERQSNEMVAQGKRGEESGSSNSSVKERRKKKDYYSGRNIIILLHGHWLQVQTEFGYY